MQLISPQRIEDSPLKERDVEVPVPGNLEVLIRVDACGMCHTDLHVIEGELPPKKSPITPGHQVIGIVERLGPGVSDRTIGERVGVAWLHRACGECAWCRRGDENLCERALFTGYDVDGGYAEYTKAPANFIYSIPGDFTSEEAAPLMCAGIIGYRSLRLSGIKPGERLGLFGFGASAHLAIQVARYWACEVFVFSRSEEHRMLATQLGAVWAGSPDDVPPGLLDAAISFAPAGEIIPKALKVLRKGGTLALAGIYMSPIPSFDYSLLYQERKIMSVANSTRRDGNDFLKLAGDIPVKTEIEIFSLGEANRGLQRLKSGKIRGAGVLKIKGP
jgi:propanol-preferring alcohol dehydrogenase